MYPAGRQNCQHLDDWLLGHIFVCLSGGSHWSLLVYSAQSRQFYHMDSSQGMNGDHAMATAKKIHHFLVRKERESGLNLFFDFMFKEVPVSTQTNGHDCGVHVLYNAEAALRQGYFWGGKTFLGVGHFCQKTSQSWTRVLVTLTIG